MKLSVIIPCFNAANTIAVQLEALAQKHWCESWEVIVSDNGSTDETVAIVEQYQDITRSVHQAIGGFDETILRLEDTDY